jgi:Ser/Thr protein kinase RdoA (MazF antagonist)
MDTTSDKPFALLTPDRVMNALDSVGLYTDGRLLALNSYENRVYQIGVQDDRPVVAKFYRPGRWSNEAILEEHAFLTELVECELPVVPPMTLEGSRTLHEFDGFRFAVFPRQGGRVPELSDEESLQRIGRLIGRIHAVGALQAFRERPRLDVATFGEEPVAFLLSHEFLPADLKEAYRSTACAALEQVKACFARAGTTRTLRLHGDCYPGNLLWTDDGPHFVDFDDSRSGPAVQDLWMLLSGSRDERTLQLAHLLAGYQSFFDFRVEELHLIEGLRTLRMIHYAAWLARRWDDPAFPASFPWFNTPHYWQQRILELRGQLAAMEEPALRCMPSGYAMH